MIKTFENYNSNFSQDEFHQMIDDILLESPRKSPDLLKLIFL